MHHRRPTRPSLVLLTGLVALLAACTATTVHEPRAGDASAAPPAATLALVGTVPVDSDVDGRGYAPTHEVWRALIDGAERTLDWAHFYASDREGSRLSPLVAALEAAGARGVRVRFLAEERFHATYPETLERLAAAPGVEVRRLDLSELTGGVLHAKLAIADGRFTCVGSANFDWRSLEHIQELGALVDSPEVAGRFGRVFALDWRIAGGESPPSGSEAAAENRTPASAANRASAAAADRTPGAAEATEAAAESAEDARPVLVAFRGEPHRVLPVFSPRGLLPEGTPWDLPRLVALVDGARERVRVQLLSYYGTDREGRELELQRALLAAARRGVKVELLLAHWAKRRSAIGPLQELQRVPNVEVRLVTVPEHASGFLPFARVAHPKYMVVDGERAWIGTSNWSRDYFHASRNAGLVIEGAPLAAELDAYFLAGWTGPYAEVVDPDAEYTAPRVGE